MLDRGARQGGHANREARAGARGARGAAAGGGAQGAPQAQALARGRLRDRRRGAGRDRDQRQPLQLRPDQRGAREGRPGDGDAARRNPAAGPRAGQSERPAHAHRVRRPPVPGLPRVHHQGIPDAGAALRAQREAADGVPQPPLHRPRLDHRRPRRRSRREPEPPLAVRGPLLQEPAGRELGLREAEVHPPDRLGRVARRGEARARLHQRRRGAAHHASRTARPPTTGSSPRRRSCSAARGRSRSASRSRRSRRAPFEDKIDSALGT